VEGRVGKPENCHIHYGAASLHKLTGGCKKIRHLSQIDCGGLKKFATTITLMKHKIFIV
jgi:hypothetical protein